MTDDQPHRASAGADASVPGQDSGSSRPRVGYLGPEGTFSEEALLAGVGEGAVEPWPLPTIYDAVTALRKGEVDWAIVPIENSLDGSINVTLDLLAGEAGDVAIVAEALLRVRHSLIAAEMLDLEAIQAVISHPQVPGQCAVFLRKELPHARIVAASSTAEAVRTVAQAERRDQAALGTVLAARIYGGTVVREGVQDRDDNETRFVWLARTRQNPDRAEVGQPPLRASGKGEWKTSVVFWGPGADRPGWLVRCLDEFARREINLTKIESRPRRDRLGNYMFFADLSGRLDDAPVAGAVAGVRRLCEEVRVLGCYPAAEEADRRP
jgi:prephenate dehydratase